MADSITKTEQWLSLRKKYVIALIIILSTGFRIVYFTQIADSPLAVFHEWNESDMNFFNHWAKDIAEGDLLSKNIGHPYHSWHQSISDNYFSKNPQQLKNISDSLALSGVTLTPEEALWDRWYGGKTLHQEPAYPYLIALTYKICGNHVMIVYLWQMILGIAINVLIYLITRRYFGDLAGIIASMIAIFYGPFLFYEGVMLRSTLLVFTGLLIVLLFDIALKKNKLQIYLLLGLVAGFAVLLKSIFLFYAAGAILIIFIKHRHKFLKPLKLSGAFITGFLIMLVPLTIRNVKTGIPPLTLASNGAVTYITSNYYGYPVVYGFMPDDELTAKIFSATNGKFLPSVIETLKTHPGILSYMKQLWNKFTAIWFGQEYPNNVNYYFFRLYAPVLKITFLSLFILAPLMIMGIIYAIFRKKNCLPLYLLFLTHFLAILSFMVLSRFRVPLIATLIPFASYLIVETLRHFRTNYIRVMIILVPAGLLYIWTTQSVNEPRQNYRFADYTVAYNYYYKSRLAKLETQKDWMNMAVVLKEMLSKEPPYIEKQKKGKYPGSLDELYLLGYFYELHKDYATVLSTLGENHLADRHMIRALELKELQNKKYQ